MKKIFYSVTTGLLLSLAGSVMAGSTPYSTLSLSGLFIYNTNSVVNTNAATMNSLQATFTSKNLIELLNASPTVSNIVAHSTGSNSIPAGSFLLFRPDFASDDVVVTNKSGFSFVLDGRDPITNFRYHIARITASSAIVSSFSRNTNSLSGKETDNMGAHISFNDYNGTDFNVSSLAIVKWNVSSVFAGSLPVTVTMSFTDWGDATFHGYDAYAKVTANANGKGHELVSDGQFPFYFWWLVNRNN